MKKCRRLSIAFLLILFHSKPAALSGHSFELLSLYFHPASAASRINLQIFSFYRFELSTHLYIHHSSYLLNVQNNSTF